MQLCRELWHYIGSMLEQHNLLMWSSSCRIFRDLAVDKTSIETVLIAAIECSDVHVLAYLLRKWPVPRRGLPQNIKRRVTITMSKYGSFRMLEVLASFPILGRLDFWAAANSNYDAFVYATERAEKPVRGCIKLRVLCCGNYHLIEYAVRYFPSRIKYELIEQAVKSTGTDILKYLLKYHRDRISWTLNDILTCGAAYCPAYDMSLLELFLRGKQLDEVEKENADDMLVGEICALEYILDNVTVSADLATRAIFIYMSAVDTLLESTSETIQKLELMFEKFGSAVFSRVNRNELGVLCRNKPEIAYWFLTLLPRPA